MEERLARMVPLVEQLHRFCDGHEGGDRGLAAIAMIAYLQGAWPDAPPVALPGDRREVVDPETLGLELIRDVGELAGMLLDEADARGALGWARANLISELEGYARAIERRP